MCQLLCPSRAVDVRVSALAGHAGLSDGIYKCPVSMRKLLPFVSRGGPSVCPGVVLVSAIVKRGSLATLNALQLALRALRRQAEAAGIYQQEASQIQHLL